MIPYARQDITQEDISSVSDVLKSEFITQGPRVPQFENAVAAYTGAKHAVAVSSGTSALHIACLALGLGSGDILWTTPITFVASANCALYCGASVDFVDIDRQTYNMSTKSLEEKLLHAEREKRLPKIVVPVHLCGQPCEMETIYSLAQRFGFHIIEDASHAVGGKYRNEPIGNCRYSDITVFSFHPVKNITTGEGGMALTNDPEMAARMALLRSHGITRDPMRMTHDPDGPWYYQQVDLGFNYRMTDLQAALGISQIKRLDRYVERRRELAQRYDRLLADFPVITPWQHPNGYSAFHLYVIRLKREMVKRTHRQIFESMREQDIGVNLHYIPIHTQPYYSKMGFNAGDFPEAENYYSEALSLPLYPALEKNMQDRVVSALAKAVQS